MCVNGIWSDEHTRQMRPYNEHIPSTFDPTKVQQKAALLHVCFAEPLTSWNWYLVLSMNCFEDVLLSDRFRVDPMYKRSTSICKQRVRPYVSPGGGILWAESRKSTALSLGGA